MIRSCSNAPSRKCCSAVQGVAPMRVALRLRVGRLEESIMRNWRGGLVALLGASVVLSVVRNTKAQRPADKPEKLTREQVVEQTMKPFQGTSEKGVDCSTLRGKV